MLWSINIHIKYANVKLISAKVNLYYKTNQYKKKSINSYMKLSETITIAKTSFLLVIVDKNYVNFLWYRELGCIWLSLGIFIQVSYIHVPKWIIFLFGLQAQFPCKLACYYTLTECVTTTNPLDLFYRLLVLTCTYEKWLSARIAQNKYWVIWK